jgi:hypothetical protein
MFGDVWLAVWFRVFKLLNVELSVVTLTVDVVAGIVVLGVAVTVPVPFVTFRK